MCLVLLIENLRAKLCVFLLLKIYKSEEKGMQSDYEMAGIHHQRNQQSPQMEEQHRFMVENNASTSSPFYAINPNYHLPQPHHPFLQQIHNLPITQQFYQYQHPHYRSMLEQQQEEIPAELVQGSFFPVSEIRGEDALIRGSERYCTQPRQTCLAVWQNQEDSAIKQPFWKPLNAEFSNENATERNKQEEEMYDNHHQQQHQHIIKRLEENKPRVLFGELEAIYGDNTNVDIHRIASESVLTADDLPTNHNVSFPELALNDSNQASGATTAMAAEIDNIGSESASVGGREAVHKRKRARESGSTTSMSRFFKSLVKKLAKQQEDLQRSFMETIERLDQERKEREQVWRERELAKLQKEEVARSHERSLALSRESALVSCLEKLTGQKINFQPFKIKEEQNHSSLVKLNNKQRWPQAEVEALIQIRTNLESKFGEAASTPKGLLWEEVSNSMSSMGFHRNARRCKEKWENMHKCSVKRRKEITLNSCTATVDFVNQGTHDKDENGSKKEDMEE